MSRTIDYFTQARERGLQAARAHAWASFTETGVLPLAPLDPGPILVGATAPLGTVVTLVGLACPTGRVHERRDGTRERIVPGAFAAFLSAQPVVTACLNHAQTKVLGSTSAGTLEVWECSAGLAFRLAVSPTNDASRAVITALDGRPRLGVSVGFRLRGTEQEQRGGVLTTTRAAIAELSLVTPPHRPALRFTWAMDERRGGSARLSLEEA